jgi:hypothetical protein
MTSEASRRILSPLLLFAQAITAFTATIAVATTWWRLAGVATLACYALMWWWLPLKKMSGGKFASLYSISSILTGYVVPGIAVLYVLAVQSPLARVLTGAGLIALLFLEHHQAVKTVDYLHLGRLTMGLVLTLLAGLGFGMIGAILTAGLLAAWLIIGLSPTKYGPR